MTSPLERLAGPGKMLAKGYDIRNLGEYEGDLNIDERIVADLIVACRALAAKLETLPPVS